MDQDRLTPIGSKAAKQRKQLLVFGNPFNRILQVSRTYDSLELVTDRIC